jgi:hypothetical protein
MRRGIRAEPGDAGQMFCVGAYEMVQAELRVRKAAHNELAPQKFIEAFQEAQVIVDDRNGRRVEVWEHVCRTLIRSNHPALQVHLPLHFSGAT